MNESNHVTARLADMLADANSAAPVDENKLGRCDWIDPDGRKHCNDFTEFQCEQVGGNWDPDRRC